MSQQENMLKHMLTSTQDSTKSTKNSNVLSPGISSQIVYIKSLNSLLVSRVSVCPVFCLDFCRHLNLAGKNKIWTWTILTRHGCAFCMSNYNNLRIGSVNSKTIATCFPFNFCVWTSLSRIQVYEQQTAASKPDKNLLKYFK